MKPPHQLERENDELRRIGIDLYERAEQWRTALEDIKKMNRDPIITSILKRHLNQ